MNENLYQIMLAMAKNNPKMKPIFDQIEKGVNPEQIFRQMCKERNIDADDFIKKLNNSR